MSPASSVCAIGGKPWPGSIPTTSRPPPPRRAPKSTPRPASKARPPDFHRFPNVYWHLRQKMEQIGGLGPCPTASPAVRPVQEMRPISPPELRRSDDGPQRRGPRRGKDGGVSRWRPARCVPKPPLAAHGRHPTGIRQSHPYKPLDRRHEEHDASRALALQ